MSRTLAAVALLLMLLQTFVAATFKPDYNMAKQHKREIKQEWEDLGWAWGKRSVPTERRYARALNPDWGDLGWTWGRK